MKLTLPQQDVYFEQLLYPDRPIYNIGAKTGIQGYVDYKILNKAYIMLINQHDAYRSKVVVNTKNEASIAILKEHDSTLKYLDFSETASPIDYAHEFMQEEFKIPFDFKSDSLLHKFILIKVNSSFFYLFSVYHHIITDGWGTSLMFQRLVKNYNELIEEGAVQTTYPFSYVSFSEDDIKYQKSEDFVTDKLYWKEKFKTLPEQLLYEINEHTDGTTSRRKTIHLKRPLYNKLIDVAKACKGSTFHVFLGILYIYFGRKHQNKDFAIGLPVLNRGKSIFKKTVGLFMGVTALRMSLDFENTFEELIIQIKQQLRRDYRHQRFPLGKLIQELGLFKEKDRLFNITLSYEKQNYADHFSNTSTSVIPLTHQAERTAVAVYIREFDDKEDVLIDLDYNIKYFNSQSIAQVASHLEELILAISEGATKKILDYKYLTNFEEEALLKHFNQTKFDYPHESTLLRFFEKQVKQYPNKIAVRDAIKQYTYKDFNAQSNGVANYLFKNLRNQKKSPIGVLMERSADLLVVLMGILKAGLAYIPLDPEFPKERLDYILNHSNVTSLIGDAKYVDTLRAELNFIDISLLLNPENTELDTLANPEIKIKATDTAYIIYTSGSTGNPKGVEIGHKSLLNFLLSIRQEPKIGNKDLLFSVTTQSFDISMLEFFTPLISGASLYIASKDLLENPLALIKQLRQMEPTVMQATPSFYQMLYNAGWDGDIRLKVMCGGDLLSESLAEKLVITCGEVWNMYGPTETTIWSSVKQITHYKDAANIGKPIHNTTFYILDSNMQLLPTGAVGNIYIGGDGVAKGYYKNENLTQEKFINNPFSPTNKMYDTGDLGRWSNEGEIVFLGRNDNQVKIRGYRIELGEVEVKLNQMKMIKSSIVVSKKNMNQEALLVAYVIPNDATIKSPEIILGLRKVLPEYMIPYTIIPIEKFPLTPNNKIDRKSLSKRALEIVAINRQEEKPKTALEKKLSTYFKNVLDLKKDISVTDNFFTLGGHSLNAVKLIAIIEEELHYQMSLKHIFDYPSIRSIAYFLQGKKRHSKEVIRLSEKKLFYPITLPQYALWLAGVKKERSIAYNMFSAYRILGEIDKTIIKEAFEKIINKYEVLRTNFVEVNGFPHQKITSSLDTNFEIDELLIINSESQKNIENYGNKAFDFENDFLLRIALFKTEKNENILMFVTHHIIMDGWSLEILIKEFVNNYKALYTKTSFIEKPLEFQYKDYAVWQQQKDQKNKDVNSQFWKHYLLDYQWGSLIPYDYKTVDENYSGDFFEFEWNIELLKNVEQLALTYKTTLHTILVSTLSILIYKTQEVDDICIGTVNSGRSLSDLQTQVGMFVKTLPLRVKIQKEQSFVKVLQIIQEDLLAMDAHQDITHNILNTFRLNAILVLQDSTFNPKKIDIQKGLLLEHIKVKSQYSRLPLLLNFSMQEEKLEGVIQYDTTKYEKETIALLVIKFQQVLEQIVINPNILMFQIDTDLEFEKGEAVEISFNF